MGLSLQLAKRWKDSDRDDFLDNLGSENEGDLRGGKLKSPPAQKVSEEEQVVGRARRKGEGGGTGGVWEVHQASKPF